MENTPDKYPKAKVYLPIFFSIVLLLGIYLGLQLRGSQSGYPEKKFFSIGLERYDKINDVINYISDSYVDSVSREDLTEDAIQNLLVNLDPHSAYIPASDFRELNDPLMGSFEGIGIEFNMISDTVVVISPLAGGPSEQVGIKPGDRIVAVNEEPIAGMKMSTSDVVSKLKGKKGTTVRVSVLRRNVADTLGFTITRDKIPSYSLDIAYMIDEQIGYIRLNKFSATTYHEFSASLNDLLEKGMEKLILDLRDNSGGFLEEAINIADEMLEARKLIVYTDGRRRAPTYAFAKREGRFETQPLVILINEWSASASEIIAGAIQDNDRGLVIGRRSFGKGLVQEQVQLADGSALRLTVARYYTPTGRSIQKPYDNGQEEYYDDLMKRLVGGELENPDSIVFNDSLKFETPGGRTVYGGGGIMPDIFVPIETGPQLIFFNQVANLGLVYRFAFDYADINREILLKYQDATSFVKSFTVDRAIYRKFLEFAEAQDSKVPAVIPAASEKLIKSHIKAYIGRNIFGNDAFYPVLHADDNAFKMAVETIREGNELLSQNPS